MQPNGIDPQPETPTIPQQTAQPLYMPEVPVQSATPAPQPTSTSVVPEPIYDEYSSGSDTDSVDSSEPQSLPVAEPIAWQAEEYIQGAKQPIWYVGFAVVVIILVAVAILTKAWTFIVLIIVMSAAALVYAHRPPRILNYSLSNKGVHINDMLHPLGEFKSFGVTTDTGRNALVLLPVKRFRPSMTIYFPTEVGEVLVDTLGGYMQMQDVRLDAFDKIARKLHL